MHFAGIQRPPSHLTLKFSVPSVRKKKKNYLIEVAFKLRRIRCHSDATSMIKATSRQTIFHSFQTFLCPRAQSSTLNSSSSSLYCSYLSSVPSSLQPLLLTLILRRSRTGTVWFYTSISNKRAARPKLFTKSLTRDLKLLRISINL